MGARTSEPAVSIDAGRRRAWITLVRVWARANASRQVGRARTAAGVPYTHVGRHARGGRAGTFYALT